MNFLSMSDAARLSKFLKLLASPHDGERAVAALKATKLLEENGQSWHVICGLIEKVAEHYSAERAQQDAREEVRREYQRSPPPPQQRPGTNTIDHRVAASSCLSLFNFWNDKESEFLVDMQYVNWPTERQLKWLRSLYERYLREVNS